MGYNVTVFFPTSDFPSNARKKTRAKISHGGPFFLDLAWMLSWEFQMNGPPDVEKMKQIVCKTKRPTSYGSWVGAKVSSKTMNASSNRLYNYVAQNNFRDEFGGYNNLHSLTSMIFWIIPTPLNFNTKYPQRQYVKAPFP